MLFLYILIFYLLILAGSCSFQTKMIFFPSRLDANFQFDKSFVNSEVTIKTKDNESINGLFFPAKNDKVILYFHGNAGSLEDWQFVFNNFKNLNFNFFIIDYRGYGKSTGKISEKGLYADGQAAYDYLIKSGFKPENIIIYGRSIGTGIAVEIASKNKSASVILESPFSYFKKLANDKFPYLMPYIILRYSFNNLKKINGINVPLLIIHGKKDEVIPFKFGKELFDCYKGEKVFLPIETGGHNNLSSYPEFSKAVSSFLSKH